MLILVLAGNQNVVQVGIAAGKATKHLINKPLEGLGRVPQTKGHASELEQAKRHDYGRLGDVRGFHGDVVVCSHQVNFAEDGSASQGGGKALQVGNRVLVLNSDVVQGPIIPTGAPVTRGLLGDHVKRRGPTA